MSSENFTMSHEEIDSFVALLTPDLFRDFHAAMMKRLEHDVRMQDAIGPLNHIEKEHLKKGDPIKAIKEVRARLNCGLKEAKDIVDAYRQEHGLTTAYYQANKLGYYSK
jgi:hypothetical protein